MNFFTVSEKVIQIIWKLIKMAGLVIVSIFVYNKFSGKKKIKRKRVTKNVFKNLNHNQLITRIRDRIKRTNKSKSK